MNYIIEINEEVPWGSVVKNLPDNARDTGLSLESATHSSILAWEISWTEKPDKQQSMGLQRVRNNLATKQQQQCVYLSSNFPIYPSLPPASLLPILTRASEGLMAPLPCRLPIAHLLPTFRAKSIRNFCQDSHFLKSCPQLAHPTS